MIGELVLVGVVGGVVAFTLDLGVIGYLGIAIAMFLITMLRGVIFLAVHRHVPGCECDRG